MKTLKQIEAEYCIIDDAANLLEIEIDSDFFSNLEHGMPYRIAIEILAKKAASLDSLASSQNRFTKEYNHKDHEAIAACARRLWTVISDLIALRLAEEYDRPL